ncbi:MAG TPA: cytochrome P450 [Sphingobium sp.]|nr:cytochrome P450 [Sphingobium sp.]
MTQGYILPPNVPASRVVDFDIYNPPELEKGVHEAWLTLHRANDANLLWTFRNGGHWIVNKGTLVPEFYVNYESFSSNANVPRGRSNAIPASMDPPEVLPYRKVINSLLSPKVIKAMEDNIRARTIALTEQLARRDGCEFVADFALKLPLELFMEWAALPLADMHWLRRYAEEMMRPTTDEEPIAKQEALASYLDPFLNERRARPGDDLLSQLVCSLVDGRPMTHDEARRIASQFIVAGLDTVAAMLSFIFLHLGRDQRLQSRLRHSPEEIPGAVEEFLRRFPLVSRPREVTTMFEFDGVTLAVGDIIIIPTALHSLDDSIFPDAQKIDLDRTQQVSATFGFGPHRCPGSTLARTELRIVLEEWLKRFPEFEIADESQVEFRAGIVAAMARLPLRWAARPAN